MRTFKQRWRRIRHSKTPLLSADVTVILLGKPQDIRTEDAKLQWKTLERMRSISKISVTDIQTLLQNQSNIMDADAIVDAIFGTGYSSKKITEPTSSAIDLINRSHAYIVSNDVPSGMDAHTGLIPDKTILPDVTVVLHRMKKGLAKNVGTTTTVSIGIPSDAES
jgi:hydroxyethylthiazole kinase-like uncharacterized protein yjeF